MAEDRDAAYYQANKDNEDDWGEPLEPTARRKLDTMVSARFTAEEAESIRAAAKAANMTQSEFVRQAVLARASGSVGTSRKLEIVAPQVPAVAGNDPSSTSTSGDTHIVLATG